MKKMVFILLVVMALFSSCGAPAPQDVQLLESGAPQVTITNQQLISSAEPTPDEGAWFRLQIPTGGAEPVKLQFSAQVEPISKNLIRKCIATPEKKSSGSKILEYDRNGLRLVGTVASLQISLQTDNLVIVVISEVPNIVIDISFRVEGGPADGELVALPSVLVVGTRLECGVPF